MSEKELDIVEDQEVGLEDDKDQLDEFKASHGDESEVADPVAKPVQIKQPNTKAGMINAMLDAVKGKSKKELDKSYGRIMASMCMGETEGEAVEESTSVQSIKELRQITSEDIDIQEDLEAIFKSDSDLTEDFKSTAKTIFEAAVVSKVNEILESVSIDLEADLEAEKVSIEESMTEKLDSYLEYVAEEWMKENELAVEQGIRSEIVENFMTGLRDLFAENYVDIPEEKVDLVDELAATVDTLETSINEEMKKTIALTQELQEARRELVLRDVSADLTESQSVKLKSLSGGVEFEDSDSFKAKLESLKENYFSNLTEEVSVEELEDVDAPLEMEVESSEKQLDPAMAAYTSAISNSMKR